VENNLLENNIESTTNDITFPINYNDIGIVYSMADGVVKILGLAGVRVGELINIITYEKTLMQALVFNLEKDFVGADIFGNDIIMGQGCLAYRGPLANVIIGLPVLGRVIDSLGNPIDGSEFTEQALENRNLIEKKAPGIIQRSSVNEPIQTGIKYLDSMIPVGRGQRELIIGDRQSGKTTIAIDSILMQKESVRTTYCIYVAIGGRKSEVAQLAKLFKNYKSFHYTVIVSASASESAALQYLAPYSGCSIAEWFRDNNQHSLIIYDDIGRQAVAYRQISLLLRRPPGREAYPGDVFYLHSRLLERAAKLNSNLGGGTLTAFPIIATFDGDVSAYIPTNVISITDGQIFIDTELFFRGTLPAVNVGLSVSRIGAAAQLKQLRAFGGPLKFQLADYRVLEILEGQTGDMIKELQQVLHRGARLVAVLNQGPNMPYSIEKQILFLFGVMNGYFDEIKTSDINLVEAHLMVFIENLNDFLLNNLFLLLYSPQQEYISWLLHKFYKAFLVSYKQFCDFIDLSTYWNQSAMDLAIAEQKEQEQTKK